jgi:hypothetical protein
MRLPISTDIRAVKIDLGRRRKFNLDLAIRASFKLRDRLVRRESKWLVDGRHAAGLLRYTHQLDRGVRGE